MESSSYSGSSKRAKALIQMTHCLVDGCNADLSLCRDYHRRHKVCEVHSKTSKVTIGGRERRFCQQCSRFHSLVEFDDGKRSCRKRLDGHNRRRRKPQTDSLQRNSSPFFSTQQGTTLLSFGTTPQMLPSSVMSSSWTGIVKPDNNIPLYNNHVTLDYIERQQLQFMQGVDHNKAKIFCDGLNKVVDSDRVLSLLSTEPTVTRDFGSNRAVEPEPLPQAVHDLQYGGMNCYSFITSQESKANVSSLHSEASTLHFSETFRHGPEGSSNSGSNQTLTFMWE